VSDVHAEPLPPLPPPHRSSRPLRPLCPLCPLRRAGPGAGPLRVAGLRLSGESRALQQPSPHLVPRRQLPHVPLAQSPLARPQPPRPAPLAPLARRRLLRP